MNDKIKEAFHTYKNCSFNNDMIGICKSFVDWMQLLLKEIPIEEIPPITPLENYYKREPHFPSFENRKKVEDFLLFLVNDNSYSLDVKLKNLYVSILAAAYVYHMPVEKMVEMSISDQEFTREKTKEILLADGMSPNWIK